MSVDLRLGDCLEVMGKMFAGSVDAIVTDPPYSSGGAFRGDRTLRPSLKYQGSTAIKHPDFSGDNRDQRSWCHWSALWLGAARRLARPGAPIVMFCDWRQLPVATDALQAGGWVWRGIAVWDKTAVARPQKGRFRAQAEYLVWGSNGPMPTPTGAPCLPGVFRHVSPRDRAHMNQKPVALLVDVLAICPPGSTVLDPFAGTGTTGVAAAQLGLDFLGIENHPDYFALAERRLAETQAQAAGAA